MATPFQAGTTITAARLNAMMTMTVYSDGTQEIDSETPAQIIGLSMPVLAGQTYRVHFVVPFVGDATDPRAFITLDGPATSMFLASGYYLGDGTSASYVQTSITSNSGCESAPLTESAYYTACGDAIITFSESGNLVVNAAASENSDVFTCQAGGILDVWQPLL
jgi:hypothetical protein